MFFGNRILKTHVSIHISKEEISKVEFTTFLGVLIDNKLTWKKHISMIKSKLSKSCAIMYRPALSLTNVECLFYTILSFCHTSCTASKYGAIHMLLLKKKTVKV